MVILVATNAFQVFISKQGKIYRKFSKHKIQKIKQNFYFYKIVGCSKTEI